MTENGCSKLGSNEKESVPNEAVPDVKDHRIFIETILVEMKSEFNRNLGMEENESNGEKSADTVKNEVPEAKSEKKNKSEKKSKDVQIPEADTVVGEKIQGTVCAEDDDDKGKIVIQSSNKGNLEADEIEKPENSENLPKSENNSQVSEEPMKVSSPKKGKPKVIDTISNKILPESLGEDAVPSTQPATPKGKRSLRSQTVVKTPQSTEEPVGVKRSARRRSKDSPRESVLQSAIARKEKSFSNLSHSEEKSNSRNFRSRIHRSPRVSPGERAPPLNRNCAVTHTRASSFESLAKPTALRTPKTPVLETTDVKPPETPEQGDKQSEAAGSIDPMDVSAKNGSDACSKSPLQVGIGAGQSYTKTGKRRYKPYKGLRYSFTTGPVKKSKLSKRQSKGGSDNVDSQNMGRSECDVAAGSPVKVENMKPESVVDMSPFIASVMASPCVGNKPALTDEKDDMPEGATEKQDSRNSVSLKRTVQSEEPKSVDSKLMRMNLSPSPVPADIPQAEALQEAAHVPSQQARTASLCLCQVESRVFVRVEASAELYCQAIDSVDEHSIGCYNAISPGEKCMLRASTALQYQLLCEVHRQRLLRHNCCAGCGMFCTQGRFVNCSSQHLYHRNCSRMIDHVAACPHCGAETPAATDFLLTMQAAKNPVFLPQQRSAVKYPHAKISFGGSFPTQQSSTVPEQESPPPPLVPGDVPHVPQRSEGAAVSIDRDKLDHLMSVASSMLEPGMNPILAQRYTLKSLYQAAKTGNVEKLITVLGAGLNPNHMFRECLMGSALHAACAGGHLSAVNVLIQSGAQPDLLDREQSTALMLAILEGHPHVVRFLVKAGASVLHKGADGMTALHLAAKAGQLECCKLLLSVPNLPRGYINSLDDGRWTPLVWAAEHRHEDIVRYLLEKRADPLIRDAEQNIALHWSAFSGSVEISEMLLNHGSDINVSNAHGDTPLHIGARQNMYDCVVLLLARGAHTDVRNKAGRTALDCCFSPAEDTHKAISLNIALQTIVRNYNKQATRVLSNDISGGKETNPIQCVNWEDDVGRPTDFLYVKENCFTSSIDVDRTITSLHSCLCQDTCTSELCMCARFSMGIWYDDGGRLLPGFNFADPPMLFECNQRCSCNQLLCKNRVMQNGMTARLQLFRTAHKGWGVQTLRPILKGSYVCEYVGEIISDSEADHREDDSYLFDLENKFRNRCARHRRMFLEEPPAETGRCYVAQKDGETYCIDARDYGNVTRFINHMCLPNLTSVRVFVEHQDLHFPRIALFANRDIPANEELGYDYGEKFWIIKCKSFTCMCGAESCRYSEATIQQTLDEYKKRVQETELPTDAQ